jgi:hypothetical protein
VQKELQFERQEKLEANMNFKLALACALLMGLAMSCTQDTPPASTADGVLSTPTVPSDKTPVAASSGTTPNTTPPGNLLDAPPKDARYTIYCLGVSGPDHTARANQIKLLWQQATHRRDWYVVHQDDQSLVYFGYYPSISDPKDHRAVDDRKMIQNLTDAIGDHPFEQAMLLPLDAPDPTAPPQWNLVNAKGAWTLEIAVYKGPDRKVAAVDSVRQARAQGIDAYYYHGPSASSVCIGTWPQAAVAQAMNGNLQDSDPSQTMVVVPDTLASQMPDSVTDEQGNPTRVLHNGAKVVDPTLQAAMQKYPTHSLNGYVDTIMVNGKPEPRSSAVVPIPHVGESTDSAPLATQRPRVDLLGGDDPNAPSATDSSAGQLRSMGQ